STAFPAASWALSSWGCSRASPRDTSTRSWARVSAAWRPTCSCSACSSSGRMGYWAGRPRDASSAPHGGARHAVKIGTVFPHADIGSDPAAIRDFAQAVEAAGFDYLIAYDHVTGAHPDRFANVTIPGF